MALQRIELAERANRSRSLEEADRLKTALLRTVSHDLRTPLTIIKSSASNLISLRGRLSADDELELVQAIDGEVDHLNRLVGNLLDMSRLQAGALALRPELNSVAEVVDDVAARAWELFHQERLDIRLDEELPLIPFDYGLILQALGNIVENVLRYEPAGSRVTISGEARPEELWLRVVNHGPSIADGEKERIMEPFYRGADGHIGLGLAISRGIVEAHRGRVWVEDTPGGGATFIIALPLRPLTEEDHAHSGRG
jgi:two-component system sensor histidine kinase KdpD